MKRPKGPAVRGVKWIIRVLGGVRWVLRADPWRGVSPPVATPMCAYCGCKACKVAIEEVEALKKPIISQRTEDSGLARVDPPKQLAKLPVVAELLVQPAWEDGEGKGERAVFVFVSSTLVKLLVKVECPPLKLLVSGRTWDEAWAALEAVLRGPDVPWEQDTPRQPQGRKKK